MANPCRALTSVPLPVSFQVDFLPTLHGFMLEAAFGECQVNCLTFREKRAHVAATLHIKGSLQRWPG